MYSTYRPSLSGMTGANSMFKVVSVGSAAQPGYALSVSGNAYYNGIIDAASLAGACISDSLTLNSSFTAASSKALSNVYAYASLACNALPLTGGTISGGLTVVGQMYASNLTVLGNFQKLNTLDFSSSNLIVQNNGTGPALLVYQVESGVLGAQPCALLLAGSNVGLYVGNTGGVGVGQSNVTAGYALDVSGAARVTSNVSVSGALSVAGNVSVSGSITNVRPILIAGLNATFTLIAVASKIPLDNIAVDNFNYWNVANYRYIPQIAGYYQCTANIMVTTLSVNAYPFIYKNGKDAIIGTLGYNASYSSTNIASGLLYLNGSNDYVEFWAMTMMTSGNVANSNIALTNLNISLISN